MPLGGLHRRKKQGRIRRVVRQGDRYCEGGLLWPRGSDCGRAGWHTLCHAQSDGHQREELLSKFRDAGSSVKTIFMSSVSLSFPL